MRDFELVSTISANIRILPIADFNLMLKICVKTTIAFLHGSSAPSWFLRNQETFNI